MTDQAGQRLRRIGWLLTPLVVWAASFLGAWLGALGAQRWGGPRSGLGPMVLGAVALAILALILWVLFLRRGTRPRAPSDRA